MMPIQERLAEIQDAIRTHAGGRSVTIVAVSKYATITQMAAAYEAGVRHFGESRVQDVLEKMAQFPADDGSNVRWHFIGNLQTNKVKKTLGRFELIHSIDSVRLATIVSEHNLSAKLRQPVLLQVNLSRDATRSGFSHQELKASIQEIIALEGITVRGLMGVAPLEASTSGNPEVLRRIFGNLAELRDELTQELAIELPELSMGMSQDYIHALACGATIVRIGNYLFKN